MLGRMMVSALAVTGVAYAQTAPSGTATTTETAAGRLTYDAAFFAQFSPQTALDMVQQTPGFTLAGGDERRGFSGAVGNLLIDGLRPTAKSQTLDSILSRIPASQVLRIELLRGAEVAGDASGQAVLLNVVRTASAGSGVYEIGFEYSGQYQERFAPRFDISYNGRNGQVEWGVGARLFSQNRNMPGERNFYDGAGMLTRHAEIYGPRDLWDPYLTANLAFPVAGGRFSTTGQINPDWHFEAQNEFTFSDPAGDPDGAFLSHFIEQGTNYEIGLNYDRDLGPWTMALIGLINRNHYENHENADSTDPLGALEATSTQDIERDSGETIVRGTLSRSLNGAHRVEFGGEGALNTLESALVFTVDEGSGAERLPIPNSNVTVEEERAEFFGVHTWRPNEAWSLETRLAWETSTLTFTGDANQETELSFWKPSVQLTRTFAGNNQVRLRYYRDVGQLNFDDFVSAAAIADEIISGGNPDLQPQTDWRTELGGDFRFPGGAALGLTLTHHRISDLADVVLIVADNPDEDPGDPDDDFIRFDAPGNLGEAEALSLNLNFSAPLTRILPGARITVSGYLWETALDDPITLTTRNFSQQPESQVEIDFRQDFRQQQWSWGVHVFKQGENQTYRFNEVDNFEEGPWIDLWWETTALPNDTRLRIWAANIGDGSLSRQRSFFDTDRSGPLILRQVTGRAFPTSPWLIVELSGTF